MFEGFLLYLQLKDLFIRGPGQINKCLIIRHVVHICDRSFVKDWLLSSSVLLCKVLLYSVYSFSLCCILFSAIFYCILFPFMCFMLFFIGLCFVVFLVVVVLIYSALFCSVQLCLILLGSFQFCFYKFLFSILFCTLFCSVLLWFFLVFSVSFYCILFFYDLFFQFYIIWFRAGWYCQNVYHVIFLNFGRNDIIPISIWTLLKKVS